MQVGPAQTKHEPTFTLVLPVWSIGTVPTSTNLVTPSAASFLLLEKVVGGVDGGRHEWSYADDAGCWTIIHPIGHRQTASASQKLNLNVVKKVKRQPHQRIHHRHHSTIVTQVGGK
jgi:hypothetical protein